MRTKQLFLQFLLNAEGAYVEDTGGRTVIGIAERFFPEVLEKIETLAKQVKRSLPDFSTDVWLYLQGKRGEFPREVKEAAEIVKDFYFRLLPNLKELPPKVLIVYWDSVVNQGQKKANRILQRTLQHYGAPIIADGVVGPKTKKALLQYANEPHFWDAFLLKRAHDYAYTKHYERFIKGWLKRLTDLHRFLIRHPEL